jgi:hypothetical protein
MLFQIREVLKADTCGQWSSVINLLTVMCPLAPPEPAKLSIDLPPFVVDEVEESYNSQYWSETNPSVKSSFSPDRFRMTESPAKNPSLWMSLANMGDYLSSPSRKEKATPSRLPPLQEQVTKNSSVISFPDDSIVSIIDYGRPRVALRKTEYSIIILSKRTIEEFLFFLGLPFRIGKENNGIKQILQETRVGVNQSNAQTTEIEKLGEEIS